MNRLPPQTCDVDRHDLAILNVLAKSRQALNLFDLENSLRQLDRHSPRRIVCSRKSIGRRMHELERVGYVRRIRGPRSPFALTATGWKLLGESQATAR